MSKLPVRSLPRATVDIDGTAVEVRGLSRAEALHFSTAFIDDAMPGVSVEDRANAAEVYLLTVGAGVSEAEAAEWRQTTDTDTVGLILDKTMELSGLSWKAGSGPKASTGSGPSTTERSTPSTSS